eukprot:6201573-Prymnesium_polylepis.1
MRGPKRQCAEPVSPRVCLAALSHVPSVSRNRFTSHNCPCAVIDRGRDARVLTRHALLSGGRCGVYRKCIRRFTGRTRNHRT